jgi:rhodanese-related sulfurtransferase
MKKIIACFLASIGLNVACAQAGFENTDVKGFAELMKAPDVVVLDVRTVDEFKEGHIKGAVNIDQAQSDFIEKTKATISTDKTIAVYCRSGRRSANAAGKLAAEGYKCVNLKGGILAWKEAKMPVTTETQSPSCGQHDISHIVSLGE